MTEEGESSKFQKRVIGSYEDIRNFVNDLNRWEQEMKSKEEMLNNKDVFGKNLKSKEESSQLKKEGNEFVKQGKWEEAIGSYSRAINLDPSNPVFYSNRALCFLKIHESQSAERDCNEAIKLDPSYTKAYMRRGLARKLNNDLKGALKDLKMVLEKEPNNVFVQSELKETQLLVQSCELENISSKEKMGYTTKNSDVSCPLTSHTRNILHPLFKLPHERSKVPLRRIYINDIFFEMEGVSYETGLKNKADIKMSTHVAEEADLKCYEVPKSTVKFLEVWNKIKNDTKKCYDYLKVLDGYTLAEIFQESLESEIFSRILFVLSTEFVQIEDNVLQYLEGLTRVKRFSTLVLFLTPSEKKCVENLIDHCIRRKECSAVEGSLLKRKYEIEKY